MFKYHEDGKLTGDCFMKVDSKADYLEVKRLNLGRIGHRYIEILDSGESDFLQARQSHHPVDAFLEKSFDAQEQGVLRCRGLPY